MPKYLMLDHGGVLDGQQSQNPTENDLILNDYGDDLYIILKDGKDVVRYLNELVKDYGYEIVFHSANRIQEQILILEDLKNACLACKLTFPPISAYACMDNKQPNLRYSEPQIFTKEQNVHGFPYAVWGDTAGNGKDVLRRVLENLLHIDAASRSDHIVFDDGDSVVRTAQAEGYQVFKIDERSSLQSCLKDIVDYERKRRIVLQPVSLLEKFINLLKILANFVISLFPFTNANHLFELNTEPNVYQALLY
jgi:hypothetical protein